ncbi:hypothetical protein ASZ78_015259 [Callipepla squamata]|uniref:Calpain-8 n=1 Tax=Callipepla squamata TaxID=9009 RepID=A0A226NM56_CALSU|nr:hypothetical protein ASZ78_015259 [Callipepla squamata]
MAGLAARLCQERAAAEGLGSCRRALSYLGQDYEALKQRCLQAGALFKDEEFPACPSALGYRDLGPYSFKTQGIVWKRPTELCDNPQFIVRGATRTDVCQGVLGDCWLLAAIASLTLNPDILYRVVPKAQSFQEDYAGIFHFQFWQYGEWVDVVVDDRLPTKNGELLFVHSEEGNEFWSALLEKAYAKLLSLYEMVYYRGRLEKLVRLRNPWGEVEWTGAWSDNAPEWNYIDPKQKQALDKQVDDGEFWMAFSDFQRQFTRLEICNLTPDTVTSNQVKKWDLTMFNGQWIRGSTAGGCQNYPATYWINPQFKICLDEPDDDHEGSLNEPCCTILVGLMQKNRRRQKRMGEGLLSIGYSLYQLENNKDIHLNRAFFTRNQPVARSETYINLREVSSRIKLPKGEYLIVPSTFEPYKNGEFCLRVFSEKKVKTRMNGDMVAAKPYEPHVDNKDIDDEFKSLFQKLSGEDCEVTATELQIILNRVLAKRKDIRSDGFNINTCREMISLLDAIYRKVDRDYSGTIDSHEMRNALSEAGFMLNNQVQQSIAIRYACSKMTIDFDGFVACMIRLETLFRAFDLLDKDKNGVVRLSLAEVYFNAQRWDLKLYEMSDGSPEPHKGRHKGRNIISVENQALTEITGAKIDFENKKQESFCYEDEELMCEYGLEKEVTVAYGKQSKQFI